MQRPRTSVPGLSSLDDDGLLQLARAGDQRAFERLVERHGPWLLRKIGRFVRDEHLAQDILQHVWLQLYRSLSGFRAQGTLPAWLAQVARNRCVDELRRKRPLTFSELASGEEEDQEFPLALLLDPSPLPEEEVEWQELWESLQEAVGTFPPRVWSVVLLRLEAQLSYGEIERVLGIPVSTAKSTFFRARRQVLQWHQRQCQREAGAGR
jgi:RNA polymerase sigma factor (sigma-70 family)